MPRSYEIKHIGTETSGRYPKGSGGNTGSTFLAYYNKLKDEGLSDLEISTTMNMKIGELRSRKTMYQNEKKAADVSMAMRLRDKGYSNVAIGARMGRNESSIRAMLEPSYKERLQVIDNIAGALADGLDKNGGYLDVGLGTEQYLGVSREKMKAAILKLKDEGYKVYYVNVPQMGTNKETSLMVLTKPGVAYTDVSNNRGDIRPSTNTFFVDSGLTRLNVKPPVNISSDRLDIVYGAKGLQKDGIVELRRGVDDLNLGKARYAQVRIAVDGTHYIKGMAMYSDSLPDGVDLRFNTGKSESLGKLGVLKPLKLDSGNVFGAVIKPQQYYTDKDGKQKMSGINLVNEEGDWEDWSKSISSQMLGKQRPALAKKQLQQAYDRKKEEYDEIMSLTNPIVKEKLLRPFADDVDAAAVHLKAAGLPRQAWAVILPFPGMAENEVYAPNHRDGENVVLVRYPHGGTFEIPELKVNNKYKPAVDVIHQAKDAIGIHPKVAEKLSGADFDGDTVLVIPNNNGAIKTRSTLLGLKDFEPRVTYKGYDGMPILSEGRKQTLMGEASNLITDMTILGATPEELTRAVRYSMVVIDAKNHKLNHKQAEIDNGIRGLKEKYQDKPTGGASTLLSKAKSSEYVDSRQDRQIIDKETGEVSYIPSNKTPYYNSKGQLVVPKTKSTKMAETKDAFTLSSGTAMETVYAEHANKLKALANDARKSMVNIETKPYSESARLVYKEQYNELNAALNIAKRNKPLERNAQIMANIAVAEERRLNPDMTGPDIKKIKGQALEAARIKAGAKKTSIVITDKQWEAIQAGAITNSNLRQILDNADLDRVKELATPRTLKASISSAKTARARTMLNSGLTQSQVADALGMSLTTLQDIIN